MDTGPNNSPHGTPETPNGLARHRMSVLGPLAAAVFVMWTISKLLFEYQGIDPALGMIAGAAIVFAVFLFLLALGRTRRMKQEKQLIEMQKQLDQIQTKETELEIAIARQSGAFDKWEEKQ